MVEEAVKSYRVAYERDESGWWVATVRGVRGCHTQGRTVDEARRRIREALELAGFTELFKTFDDPLQAVGHF